MAKQGYSSNSKTGVQIRKIHENGGTDQFFWRAKQGYRSPFLCGKVPKLIFQHRGYVGFVTSTKTGVQINFFGDQKTKKQTTRAKNTKQGYRSRKPRNNRGTDQ